MEEGDLAAGKSTAAARGPWLVFADEAGQSMTPPRSKTWGRVGRTPVVRVRGRGSGRMSMAGMVCYRPGARSRLIYAIREYHGRKDELKGFGWRDLRNLLVRARIQLGGPIVLVWDNVRLHPQEGIWSLVKRDLGNLAAADLGEITRAVKHRLKKIQYRPDLIDCCLVGTGLSPHSGEPTTNQPNEGSGTAGSPIEQLRYRRAAGCPGRGALLTGG
ncbi:transposase [Streptomyces sp. NPDC048720]|uniref:transposase n=1 Tax=Streptomyces sp. NPDC048720 TaxID=3365588 RepID=UPI003710B555